MIKIDLFIGGIIIGMAITNLVWVLLRKRSYYTICPHCLKTVVTK